MSYLAFSPPKSIFVPNLNVNVDSNALVYCADYASIIAKSIEHNASIISTIISALNIREAETQFILDYAKRLVCKHIVKAML